MIDFLQYGEKQYAATVTALWRLPVLSAAIAALGLVLLLVCAVRRRQKRVEGEGVVTEELPVAAVQASLGGLRTLEEIVCCESKEIIP